MGDESRGRESNINCIYMRELPTGLDGFRRCGLSCLLYRRPPAVTLTKGTTSVSHLETKNKSTVLPYKPSKSGHEVT